MSDFVRIISEEVQTAMETPPVPMLFPVQVIFREPQGGQNKCFQIVPTPGETVQTLKTKLAQKIGTTGKDAIGTSQDIAIIGTSRMSVIFCGRALPDGTRIADLALGPQTALNLKIAVHSDDDEEEEHEQMRFSGRKNDHGHEDDEEDEDEGGLSSSNEDDCAWVKIAKITAKNNGKEKEEAIAAANIPPRTIDPIPDLPVSNFADEPLEQPEQNDDEQQQFDTTKTSNFHVFCKHCSHLERAKMRAYCRCCNSSAIIFNGANQEPKGWADVLDSNKLRVNCSDCEQQEQGVVFRFKCLRCNEFATPLMHVKRSNAHQPQQHEFNQQQSLCAICNEKPALCYVNLGCPHIVCVDCFQVYAGKLLDEACLTYNHQVGYTITCPVYNCPAFLSDVHTFYLLGVDEYKKYQETAARLFFDQQISQRHYCPGPQCGAAFFIEDTEEADENTTTATGKMFMCPECSRMFCRFCRTLGSCRCLDQPLFDNESASLIREISKPCPRCRAPTERTGGCSHIHCTRCQHDWCFICQQAWSESCQWDHWFE